MQLGNHADHKEMEIEVQVDIVLLELAWCKTMTGL
jgi:hypothetical protein